MKRAIGAAIHLSHTGRESDSGKPKNAAPANRYTYDLRASRHVVFDDCDIVRHGIRSACAGDGSGPSQRYAF